MSAPLPPMSGQHYYPVSGSSEWVTSLPPTRECPGCRNRYTDDELIRMGGRCIVCGYNPIVFTPSSAPYGWSTGVPMLASTGRATEGLLPDEELPSTIGVGYLGLPPEPPKKKEAWKMNYRPTDDLREVTKMDTSSLPKYVAHKYSMKSQILNMTRRLVS